ncbi:LrgB family protein [Clostridium sp. Marseille-P2415]|uniref:LrgB family protein n=1 Tax=Clostridium sp. Marseille-P2415 TaxID=1805471 RepID=UPI0009888C45|nr:LrgB family protein [Clostridium sp. Marseille-P2415]
MSSTISDFLFFGAVISILGYELGVRIKKRFRLAIFNPLLISILAVMAFLSAFQIDYEAYNGSAKYISYLLTPATVCLAVPLYRQLELLKKHSKAILAGTLTGVLTTMVTVLLLALIFNLNHQQYVTFLPKSITTAIAMGISEEMKGFVTITVASIIITGILGSIIAETVCRVFKITDPVAIGIAIGSSSHAVGTTKAMEMGEIEGAMSSLAIATSGLCTVVFASIFSNFI